MREPFDKEYWKNYPFVDVTVFCLKCGGWVIYTQYRTPPASKGPDHDKTVVGDSVFRCSCGNRDPRQFMVICERYADGLDISTVRNYSSCREKIRREMKDVVGHGYLIRHVPDVNSLEEKIRIFDDGLDDRIIELIKALVSDGLVRSYPAYVYAPGGCRLYYRGRKDRKELVVCADGLPDMILDIAALYDEVGASETAAQLPPLRDCDTVIDMEWAAGQLNAAGTLKWQGELPPATFQWPKQSEAVGEPRWNHWRMSVRCFLARWGW